MLFWGVEYPFKAFSIYQKNPEISVGNDQWWRKCSLWHKFHSILGSLARLNSFPLNFKKAAQMLILNEIVELTGEEGLSNSEDDDETPVLAAVST